MTRFFYLCLLFGLSACTSVEERQRANGNTEYTKEVQQQQLQIPPGLDQPRQISDYDIPPIGSSAEADLIGKKLTVVSPALVLPLVTGSHVEEGAKEATVYFDQVDDSQPLEDAIWNSLLNYLSEQGIGVDLFDKQKRRLVTDWMIIESEDDSPWYSWSKAKRSIGRRFEFKLDVKPHGRSASLNAVLRDYLETVNDQVVSELGSDKIRRNEADVLNKVIGHYENQIRVANARRLNQIRSGLKTDMGFNADGEPAYVVSAEYQVAWPRMLLVLRKMGFNVKDLDQSNGLLFVNYLGSEDSWWSSLWGDDDALPIEQKEYRIKVTKQGEKTTVTFMDEESNPFSAKQVSELYSRFSETMSADDLDI